MKKNEIKQAFDQLTQKYMNALLELQNLQKLLESNPTEIFIETPSKPIEVEKPASGDLREAARLLCQSEFNKEDLSEKQIFEILMKQSREEVNRTLGFWAVPLPLADTDNNNNSDKPRYTRKQ